MLRSQTKYVEPIEQREYIRRDDLVYKHHGKCTPKESHGFAVRSRIEVKSLCLMSIVFIRQ